jgi:glycosyltransferase involved in cell wall biosynthesis
VVPYALSRRAKSRAHDLPPNTRVLPLPAGLAIRTWGFADRPRVDRYFDDVDVVHGTNFVVPPTRRPSSVTVHDAFCLVHPNESPPSVRPFDRAVRRAVQRGAWVHTSTNVLRYQMLSLYGAERVKIVPFGVPAVAQGGPLPDAVHPPYILSINTLEPRKRQEHLVRAFRSVAAWDENLQLVIAGADGPASDAVNKAIKALPAELEARVVRIDRVDDDLRAALIRRASILAYPSADEGFGFPVLEAMAVGVPVVATFAGGIPEIAGAAALLVPIEDDPGVLVEALRRVITDGGLRATLRRRGRERAERFSWPEHAAGMAELWRTAADAA